MATVLRKTDPLCKNLADAVNDLKAQIGAGSSFHLDKSERTISSPNATDLATALTLCQEIRAVYEFHRVDTLAHKVADTTAVSATAVLDLASAIAVANDIKAKYNTHIASTTFHYTADATNATAAANATDLPSLETLLNELKGDMNAHMGSGPAAASLRLVDA